MIQVEFSRDGRSQIAYGLTQGDYGQKLSVSGINLQATDIQAHFTSNSQKAATRMLASVAHDAIEVSVPDALSSDGQNIICYIYVTDESSGRTVYTIYLPVRSRKLPEDMEPPEQEDIVDQILSKINSKADNVFYDHDTGEFQLTSNGNYIGDRIRLAVTSGGGREIELKNNGTEIQWRYTDSNEWHTLITVDDLRGAPGEAPGFELRDGHLYAIYQNENPFGESSK